MKKKKPPQPEEPETIDALAHKKRVITQMRNDGHFEAAAKHQEQVDKIERGEIPQP